MYTRLLEAKLQRTPKSVLLLGPRQVGKSTLMKSLRPDFSVNLALEHEYLLYSSNPKELFDQVESHSPKTILIDEVQRLPSLLNTAQALIDERKVKFLLTGSSARKLKRGGANLLPGRLLSFEMGPLCAREFNYQANTEDMLIFGGLPGIVTEKNRTLKQDLLRNYTGIYLREEILAEALTRNLEAFSRFMMESMNWVGHFIDLSKFAKKARISRHSCPRFFEIFEDTLIGFRINPFSSCLESADLIKHPKFYFFDSGILNGLLRNFTLSADRKGVLAEQLVFSQLRSSAKALDKDIAFSSFRTRGGAEIDFVVQLNKDVIALEVKAGDSIIDSDTRALVDFKKYYSKKHFPFIWHMGKKSLKINGVWSLPWQVGLREIGL